MLVLKPPSEPGLLGVDHRPEAIELEYKLRMTRSFGADEISARFQENLVDRFLAMEEKRQRQRHKGLHSSVSRSKFHEYSHQRSQLSSGLSVSNSINYNDNHSNQNSQFLSNSSKHRSRQTTASSFSRNTSSSALNRYLDIDTFDNDLLDDDDNMDKNNKSVYKPIIRTKFVHSAPVTGNRVKFSAKTTTKSIQEEPRMEKTNKQNNSLLKVRKLSGAAEKPVEKIELTEQVMTSLNKDERNRLFASLAELKARLKLIDDEEAKVLPASSRVRRRDDLTWAHSYASSSSSSSASTLTSAAITSSSRYNKTITRELKPLSVKSMSVDKWIEVHKRRTTSVSALNSTKRRKSSSKVQLSQNEKLKLLNEKLKQKIAEHNKLNNSTKQVEQPSTATGTRRQQRLSMSASSTARRFRSRRELIDLTVLDRIQSQIRVELEQNLTVMRKLESQNEFNSVVARIREFLLSSSSSTDNNNESLTTPRTVCVYEYNMFKA